MLLVLALDLHITYFLKKINGKYDAVKSYRNYYISEKLNNKTEWKNRKIPKVFKEKMEEICL